MQVAPGELIAGALAVYGTADDLGDAIVRARQKGFTRLDAVSPYPLHGIDQLLGKGPSRLGYLAAAAGLTATAIAKTVQWWISAVDYPLNIGGNPLFALPAFVPVTFELMVLFASLTTVIGMLAVFNGLPQYGSALLRSRHIRDLTCNRYGLVIDGADKRFDPNRIEEDLTIPLPEAVELLTRPPRNRFYAERILSVRFLVLLVGVALLASTSTRLVFRYGGEIPPFDFMKRQQHLAAQRPAAFFPDQPGMRLPVEGTVARGYQPYAFQGQPENASASLVNPVAVNRETLSLGQKRYTTFCQPCHGKLADGRGTLTAAFPQAPTLHSTKAREWNDGRIYAVVTEGQNAMPAHAAQIPRTDRWHIIHHLRVLQRSQNAREQDLP
jgi:cytochrome c5